LANQDGRNYNPPNLFDLKGLRRMSNNQRRIRVGAVRYLNTKPLVFGLAEAAPQIELVYDLPSRLADSLAAGRLDVALIPSIEVFHNPGYSIISDACIACRGPVWSVKLFSKVPVARIRTLALDEGSRTSVALVQILLHERYGIRPELCPLPIGQSAAQSPADAVLLIGDRAIQPPPGRYAEVWDLGDEWCRWAELPFVFAMWAVGHASRRARDHWNSLSDSLTRARDAGLANLESIAAEEAAAVGLTARECLHYLRDNLHFQLGPREREGLALFYEHAARLNLAPPGVELRYDECVATR
jgi:chorismate dehydratase